MYVKLLQETISSKATAYMYLYIQESNAKHCHSQRDTWGRSHKDNFAESQKQLFAGKSQMWIFILYDLRFPSIIGLAYGDFFPTAERGLNVELVYL